MSKIELAVPNPTCASCILYTSIRCFFDVLECSFSQHSRICDFSNVLKCRTLEKRKFVNVEQNVKNCNVLVHISVLFHFFAFSSFLNVSRRDQDHNTGSGLRTLLCGYIINVIIVPQLLAIVQ